MREPVGHLLVGQCERIGEQPYGVQQAPQGEVQFGAVGVEPGGRLGPSRRDPAEGDGPARVGPGRVALARVRGGGDEPQPPEPAEDVRLGERGPQVGDGVLGAPEREVVVEPVRAGLGPVVPPQGLVDGVPGGVPRVVAVLEAQPVQEQGAQQRVGDEVPGAGRARGPVLGAQPVADAQRHVPVAGLGGEPGVGEDPGGLLVVGGGEHGVRAGPGHRQQLGEQGGGDGHRRGVLAQLHGQVEQPARGEFRLQARGGLPGGPAEERHAQGAAAGQPVDGAGEFGGGAAGRVVPVEGAAGLGGGERGQLDGEDAGADALPARAGRPVRGLGEPEPGGLAQRLVVADPGGGEDDEPVPAPLGGAGAQNRFDQLPAERFVGVVEEEQGPADAGAAPEPGVGVVQVLGERPDEEGLGLLAPPAPLLEVVGELLEPGLPPPPGVPVSAVPPLGGPLHPPEHLFQDGLHGRLGEHSGERGGGLREGGGELGEDLADPVGGGAPGRVDGREERPEPLEVAPGPLVVLPGPADRGDGHEPEREPGEPHGPGPEHLGRELHGQLGERAGERGPAGAVVGGRLDVGAVEQRERGVPPVPVPHFLEQRGLPGPAPPGEHGDRRIVPVLVRHPRDPVPGEPAEPRDQPAVVQDRLAAVQLSVQAPPPP